LDTFSPDHPINVRLRLRDSSGVSLVSADFEHEDGRNYVVVRGDGGMKGEATVTLTPSEWSGALLSPGEYLCRRIEAWDTLGNVSVFTHETHPHLVDYRFRYEYPRTESDDQEGPELLPQVSED
jgi:hypothetical protein